MANEETGVPSSLPDDIRESVAVTNVKTLAEGPAFYSNIAMANAVALQQQMGQVGVTIAARATELIAEKQVDEAGALATMLQQLAKIAQTTPPPTA